MTGPQVGFPIADVLSMIDSPAVAADRPTGLAGAGLVGISGVGLVVAQQAMDLSRRESNISVFIGIGVLVLAGVLAALPWNAMPRRSLVIGPIIIAASLALDGLLVQAETLPLLGFMLLGVFYMGITLPRGTTLLALPLLLADWWLAFPEHPAWLVARLPLVIAVLLTVGELTAFTQYRWRTKVATLWTSSNTDPLTNVGNRRALARHLANLSVGGSVLFIDLDNFKTFNDRYGHAAGDVVLMQFADATASVLRADDVVARFGGEEFVVVINDTVGGVEIFNRIRNAWHLSGAAVTFSAGFARRHAGEAAAVTLSRADAALYQAKVNGRDRLERAEGDEETAPNRRHAADGRPFDLGDDEITVRDLLDRMGSRPLGGRAVVEDHVARDTDG